MTFDNNLKERKHYIYNSLLKIFPNMNDDILKLQLEYMSDDDIDNMYYVLNTFDEKTVKQIVGD